jgi:hypothetical protein
VVLSVSRELDTESLTVRFRTHGKVARYHLVQRMIHVLNFLTVTLVHLHHSPLSFSHIPSRFSNMAFETLIATYSLSPPNYLLLLSSLNFHIRLQSNTSTSSSSPSMSTKPLTRYGCTLSTSPTTQYGAFVCSLLLRNMTGTGF